MPDHWQTTTLGEAAEVVSGGTPATSVQEYWNGEIVWVTPTEIVANDGGVIFDSQRKISQEGLKASSAKVLPVDAVLLTSRATIGAVALAGVPLATNQGFASLVCGEKVLPRFAMYWCQCNKQELVSRAGGNTFLEVSRKKVAAIPLSLPPLAEQRRIVDLVGSIDAYITALDDQITATRTARGALLSELLSSPGADWQTTTLGEVATIVGGSTPSTNCTEFWGGPVSWVTTSELSGLDDCAVTCSERTITAEAVKRGGAKMVRAGATLLGTTATIGTVAIARIDLCFNQQISGLVSQTASLTDDFLFVWARANRRNFARLAAGTSFKRISSKALKEVDLVLPPLPEQRRIVDLVGSFDDQVAALEAQVGAARVLRSGVLSELLSGERLLDESYDVVVGL
jgi:type I restriction enzyme S subunit